MAEIKAITLPSGDSYDIVDQGARDLIANLPSPMVFKGTIGDSKPTASYIWSELPAASGAQGFTYKVISNHSTTPICKNGDTIVSNGVEWVVIPSGDEPSGTVTSVGAGTGLTGGTITDSGTIAVDFAAVQEKLPAGQNDTYLHLNETTGAIEWSEVQSNIPDNIVLASSTTISPREIGDTFSGHSFNEFALKDDLPNIDAITSQFYTKSETNNLLSGKQTSITASGMLKGDGAGSVSAATAGEDYAAASHSHSASSISAGTFTGAVVAQNNTDYTTKQVRNVFLSTGSPSGGASGDIWIKYTN